MLIVSAFPFFSCLNTYRTLKPTWTSTVRYYKTHARDDYDNHASKHRLGERRVREGRAYPNGRRIICDQAVLFLKGRGEKELLSLLPAVLSQERGQDLTLGKEIQKENVENDNFLDKIPSYSVY